MAIRSDKRCQIASREKWKQAGLVERAEAITL